MLRSLIFLDKINIKMPCVCMYLGKESDPVDVESLPTNQLASTKFKVKFDSVERLSKGQKT